MSKVAKPLAAIVVAIAVAAAAAMFWSRRPAPVTETSAAPVLDTKFDGGHVRGPATAKITLIEFGDYQCPSCGAYHPILTELLTRYPTQLRLEFHHYPIVSLHPYAMAAAMAAEAAGEQGRYWEMHDLLFQNQQAWSQSRNAEPDFLAMAARIGVNVNAFMQAMRSPQLQDRILQDVVRAREAKVDAVPAFFIDGQHIDRPPTIAEFAQVIDTYLQKTPGVGGPAGSKTAGEAGVQK